MPISTSISKRCLAWSTALLATVAVSMALASTAAAGGYAQGLQGASSAGVSGAMTGRADTPEAGYYNPAGWALQDDWGASVGGSGLLPMVYHEAADGARTRAEVDGAFPPFAHGFVRIGEVAAGLSVGVPYGASLQWPDDWEGRFEATGSRFQAFEAAPSVAWRPVDWLAVGGGPRLVWSTIGFERRIDFARDDDSEEGVGRFDASAPGLGAQLGIWGQFHDLWSVGASWRSGVDLEFSGVGEFDGVPPEMQDNIHDSRATTEMVLPHRFAVGVAYEVMAMGVISVDVEYSLWSAYDTFAVDFESEDVQDITDERNWENTLSMRAGAEYVAPVDGLVIRSGISYEPSPAPEDSASAAQPDTDRTTTSFGVGYDAIDYVEFDLAYNFSILSRTGSSGQSLGGAFDGQIHAVSAGLRFRPPAGR